MHFYANSLREAIRFRNHQLATRREGAKTLAKMKWGQIAYTRSARKFGVERTTPEDQTLNGRGHVAEIGLAEPVATDAHERTANRIHASAQDHAVAAAKAADKKARHAVEMERRSERDARKKRRREKKKVASEAMAPEQRQARADEIYARLERRISAVAVEWRKIPARKPGRP